MEKLTKISMGSVIFGLYYDVDGSFSLFLVPLHSVSCIESCVAQLDNMGSLIRLCLPLKLF